MSLKVQVLESMEEIGLQSSRLIHGDKIAVSGGSTFAAVFPMWVEAVSKRSKVGENLRFFPVDERKVSYEEPGCNWKVCVDSLLTPAGLGVQKNHYVGSIAAFQSLLEVELKPEMNFDTVFLGMGNDGHTASLFPGESHLKDTESFVLETISPKAPFQRLTLGLKAIWEAKHLVALVSGPDKAEMVKRLVEGDQTLPITLAMQGHPNSLLLLDAAAASKL